MLCIGSSITLFVIGRILQGMSAAMVWTVGLALLADTVDKEELGKCLGYITLAMNGGTLLGPLLGGVVYDNGGYYAVFAMAFVLLGSDIVLRLVMVEKKIARRYTTATEGPSYGTSSAVHAEAVRLEAINAPGPSTVEREISMPISGNDDRRRSWRRTLPPVVWLLGSRRTLVALFAAMVFGVMITGFDAVSFLCPSTLGTKVNFDMYTPRIRSSRCLSCRHSIGLLAEAASFSSLSSFPRSLAL